LNRYLLDTHVLLWWLFNSRPLSHLAQKAIRDPANTLFVSSATIWEMATKRTLGRLEYPDNLLDVLNQQNMQVLSIDAPHALTVAQLPLLHQDPFDRMLVAQAKVENLTLITSDSKITAYNINTLIA
jgi:PIN domain nuclease of toxin-antitoxin system